MLEEPADKLDGVELGGSLELPGLRYEKVTVRSLSETIRLLEMAT